MHSKQIQYLSSKFNLYQLFTFASRIFNSKEHFTDVVTKNDRNLAIQNAYLDGYYQIDIASYLKVSKSLILNVIKSGDSITGV